MVLLWPHPESQLQRWWRRPLDIKRSLAYRVPTLANCIMSADKIHFPPQPTTLLGCVCYHNLHPRFHWQVHIHIGWHRTGFSGTSYAVQMYHTEVFELIVTFHSHCPYMHKLTSGSSAMVCLPCMVYIPYIGVMKKLRVLSHFCWTSSQIPLNF